MKRENPGSCLKETSIGRAGRVADPRLRTVRLQVAPRRSKLLEEVRLFLLEVFLGDQVLVAQPLQGLEPPLQRFG